MNSHSSTYFENSHRAALADQAYCIANPLMRVGYSSNIWGLTACDGPNGYAAHGAPPAESDDGTVAPTGAGGAIAFAPEIALPTLKYLYRNFRSNIWTAYGFVDSFNFSRPDWNGTGYDTDELGIDQGPIVIMIENYRTQRVWQLFQQNPEIQRGLQRAGFVSLPFVLVALQTQQSQNTVTLTWGATAGRTYQVEYSPDLFTWFTAPTGEVTATNSVASWTDTGPPGTTTLPFGVSQRFYRVFQYGPH
jgi:hypothetical protein